MRREAHVRFLGGNPPRGESLPTGQLPISSGPSDLVGSPWLVQLPFWRTYPVPITGCPPRWERRRHLSEGIMT
jgi:hypothetical protein